MCDCVRACVRVCVESVRPSVARSSEGGRLQDRESLGMSEPLSCEERGGFCAVSQNTVRTLSEHCQNAVRTLSERPGLCQNRCGSSTNQVICELYRRANNRIGRPKGALRLAWSRRYQHLPFAGLPT